MAVINCKASPNSNEKMDILEKAKKALLKEFVGIDDVIEKVMATIQSWYLFPDLQEVPVVINLWGMTGVGKTALVEKLVRLLNFEQKFFVQDMGRNSEKTENLDQLLKKKLNGQSGEPYIILLDEFQNAKTKDEELNEINNSFSRVVWELLDTGKFQVPANNEEKIKNLLEWREILSNCLFEEIEVENGIVVKNEDVFLDMLNQEYECLEFFDVEHSNGIKESNTIKYSFLPKFLLISMYKFLPGFGKNYGKFKELIFKSNGQEIISLLNQALENAKSNEKVDCSKSLIFVLGNLDEAFSMSSSLNPDINANDFHEHSKQININHIKHALKKRFRLEQIARLGNNHIIYPAFSEDDYNKLIRLKLRQLSLTVYDEFEMLFFFSDEFIKLIYKEGVFPTQGARPLFSTIYQMVNAKISSIIATKNIKNLKADSIQFDFKEGKIIYEYFNEETSLYSYDEKITCSLEKLRAPTRDNAQAITAVHESGHAVASIMLFDIVPEFICSTTSDINSAGFVYFKDKKRYFPKDELLPRIAVYLAGIAAEELIFGADRITSGSYNDLEEATELAIQGIKYNGMGSFKGKINIRHFHTRFSYHDEDFKFNAEVKSLLDEAYILALKTLSKGKKMLINFANYLSEERMLHRNEIELMILTHGSEVLYDIYEKMGENENFYRDELKRQVKELELEEENEMKNKRGAEILLN